MLGFNKWKILNSYRKNKDDIKSILLRTYPDFIFKSMKELPEGEIPIFTFHSVEANKFEYLIKYLADNNYKTITSNTYYDFLCGKKKVETNTIMLTFDDGLGSLWSVAYPILKKYGLSATSFLLPAVIKEDFGYLPNLEDLWAGKASPEEIDNREKVETFCSWKEVRIMQSSGVFDFQSHSYDHRSIFKSHQIVDFMNPNMDDSFLTGSFNPVVLTPESEYVPEKLDLGYPIYKWGANLGETKRYLEDYEVSAKCVEFVNLNGSKKFFNKSDWKKEINNYYNKLVNDNKKVGRYQTEEERFEDIKKDLSRSKKTIEIKIDKEVNHLCYPWGLGSDLAVEASKEAGFISNYWCHLNRNLIMKVGEDPYYIPRILYEDYILSLPGKKRISFGNQLKNKFNKYVLKQNLSDLKVSLK
jgi:hypothetical protein